MEKLKDPIYLNLKFNWKECLFLGGGALPNLEDLQRQPVAVFQIRIPNRNVEKKDGPQKIPVQATIFSASWFVLNSILFGSVHYLDNLTPHQRVLAVQMICTVIIVLRCPLVALITFSINKKKKK